MLIKVNKLLEKSTAFSEWTTEMDYIHNNYKVLFHFLKYSSFEMKDVTQN